MFTKSSAVLKVIEDDEVFEKKLKKLLHDDIHELPPMLLLTFAKFTTILNLFNSNMCNIKLYYCLIGVLKINL
jgi:GR25 family glycosyltransferase involved in LPS biosynthesis